MGHKLVKLSESVPNAVMVTQASTERFTAQETTTVGGFGDWHDEAKRNGRILDPCGIWSVHFGTT